MGNQLWEANGRLIVESPIDIWDLNAVMNNEGNILLAWYRQGDTLFIQNMIPMQHHYGQLQQMLQVMMQHLQIHFGDLLDQLPYWLMVMVVFSLQSYRLGLR